MRKAKGKIRCEQENRIKNKKENRVKNKIEAEEMKA